MSSSSNGRHADPHDPSRRLRFDDLSAILEQASARGRRKLPWHQGGYSGRRFVVIAGVVVLIVWGLLYLTFREWRARYLVRAAYGANQVAPAIDAFAEIAPPGLAPGPWQDAVARTHAMLQTVTGSNLLGLEDMHSLRDELNSAAALARAQPESAVARLAAVWDDMSERAEFLLRDTRRIGEDRHPRPSILPTYAADRVIPALDPLDSLAPPGVEGSRWRDAVARTRRLLQNVTASRQLSAMRMKDMRAELDRAVDHARAHPEDAVTDLARIWDNLNRMYRSFYPERAQPKGSDGPNVRPAILADHPERE